MDDLIKKIVSFWILNKETIAKGIKAEGMNEEAREEALIKEITNRLYFEFYVNSPNKEGEVDEKTRLEFENLRKRVRNKYRVFQSQFWKILKIENDNYTLMKNHLELEVSASEIRAMNPNKFHFSENDYVATSRFDEFSNHHFYFVYGRRPFNSSIAHTVRMYFPVEAKEALEVKNKLQIDLDLLQIPYMFKFLVNEKAYNRRSDRMVLYFEQRYTDYIVEYCETNFFFKEQIEHKIYPLFTHVLPCGVSIGESPLEDEHSFGTMRCELIARYLLLASQNNLTEEETGSYVLQNLESYGFDLLQFFRNPATNFPYKFSS